jgi:hypothetical protein
MQNIQKNIQRKGENFEYYFIFAIDKRIFGVYNARAK